MQITITDTGAPPQNAAAVTPDDNNDLAQPAQALYVGFPGDLKVTTVNGQVVTLQELKPGFYQFSVRRIWATGTTAGEIVAWL